VFGFESKEQIFLQCVLEKVIKKKKSLEGKC